MIYNDQNVVEISVSEIYLSTTMTPPWKTQEQNIKYISMGIVKIVDGIPKHS